MADDGLDFSPLTPEELEAAAQETAAGCEQDTDKPTLPPVDAEPPEIAAARLFGRPPESIWRYATAEGETAFDICRYNTKGGLKDFLPRCWFSGHGWQSKHWPAPRPLYNLDRVAARPHAPIIVCEGEKAADAAACIFPKFIATTSSGGSSAFSKTDWMPVAGRRVLIWPDADEPGAEYGREVATILVELDCDVSVIDADTLAAIDPQSGVRKAAKGWDAANAMDEWKDLSALSKAILSLTKPFDPGPAYISFGPYTMDAKGLTVEIPRRKDKVRWTETVRIAGAFEVRGQCRDPRGDSWGKVICWLDADGFEHSRYVPDAALHGDPALLCAGLADGGLSIDRAYQRQFARYLSEARVRRRARLVALIGWHEIGERLVFTLPSETIGPRNGESVIFESAANHLYDKRGTVGDWREGVGKLARGQVLAVFAISVALCGPLLFLTGIEGGGFHLFGHSSKGKTTLLRMAASIWGRGGTPGYVGSWRATANGLEGAAADATDTLLTLDELGQVQAGELAIALYSLSSGTGKTRAMRDGSLRAPRSWRISILSSGELPVGGKLIEEKGRKPRAGQLVRLLDIPAARPFGVFDDVGPNGAAAFAEACALAATTAYGTAGPEFVRRLIAEHVTGEDVRSMVDEFVAGQVSSGADGQVVRAAHRFGIVATAGELATRFQIAPWRAGEARTAAAWALEEWIDGRDGTEPAEVRQAIAQVRLFIEQHGDSRFDSLDNPDARPVINRAGWRKSLGENRRWMIPTEVWKVEVCAGLDPKFTAKVLAERGMLERESDGNAKVVKIEGTSKRVYVITPRIFDGSF
jgi:uncharacterized protein (DUF927 family)